MITLFSTEKLVTATEGGVITLTNYRIVCSDQSWGHSRYESIFLEDISLMKTIHKSYIIFLYLAGLCVVLAAFATYGYSDYNSQYTASNFSTLSVIIAFCSVLLWFFTRSRTIAIYSHSGNAIALVASAWSHDKAVIFLEELQLVKAQRVYELSGKQGSVEH